MINVSDYDKLLRRHEMDMNDAVSQSNLHSPCRSSGEYRTFPIDRNIGIHRCQSVRNAYLL